MGCRYDVLSTRMNEWKERAVLNCTRLDKRMDPLESLQSALQQELPAEVKGHATKPRIFWEKRVQNTSKAHTVIFTSKAYLKIWN